MVGGLRKQGVCPGEHHGTGAGQELPLALPCGAAACVFIGPRPKKVAGERLNLGHRPPGHWPKPETESRNRFSLCIPRMEREECGGTAGRGHTLGLRRIPLSKRREKEGPGLGTQKMSLLP